MSPYVFSFWPEKEDNNNNNNNNNEISIKIEKKSGGGDLISELREYHNGTRKLKPVVINKKNKEKSKVWNEVLEKRKQILKIEINKNEYDTIEELRELVFQLRDDIEKLKCLNKIK